MKAYFHPLCEAERESADPVKGGGEVVTALIHDGGEAPIVLIERF